MIPKTINYCWFGDGELSSLNRKCIKSWKDKCPDYKIIEWNETNYDISKTPQFVQDAYKKHEWSFVSDYARLDIIYNNGGIYLDTDVEVLKSLNVLLKNSNGYMGFESEEFVNSGLGFASEKGNKIIAQMMQFYRNISFDEKSKINYTCPVINTKVLKENGLLLNNKLQVINGIKILPTEYLCPKNIYTGKTKITSKTVSIHYYNASWLSSGRKAKFKFIIIVKKILPKKIVSRIRLYVRNKRNEK